MILLKIMTNNIHAKIDINKNKSSKVKPEYPPTLQHVMNIPYYLSKIQPRSTQVWNYNEIGFNPDVNWHKVIFK